MAGARIPTAMEAGLGQMKAQPLRTGGFDARASAADFGANTGAALAEAGQGLMGAGHAARSYDLKQQQQQEFDDRSAANKQALEAEMSWHQRLRDEQINAPAGAAGFTERVNGDFEKWKAEQLQGSTLGAAGKRDLEEHLTRLGGSLWQSASRFEDTSKAAKAETDLASSAETARNLVYTNPDRYADVLAQQHKLIDGAPIGEASKAKLRQSQTEALTEARTRALAERDPRGMVKVLTEGDIPGLAYRDRVTIKNAAEADVNRLDAEEKQRRNEAEAKAKQALQEARVNTRFLYEDELSAAARGETVGQDVDRRIATTFDPKDSERMLAQLNLVRRTAASEKRLSVMTPAEMQVELEKVAPSGEGYAGEAKSQDYLREAAANVLERRQKDPAAEVQRAYPQIAKLLSSDDPADLAEGLRWSASMQQTTFGLAPDQVRPLSKEGAARVVERFNAAGTADEKLAVVSGLTLALKDDRISRTVLDQLEAAKLPAGVDLALERLRAGDPAAGHDARAIVSSLVSDPKDAPKLAEVKTKDVEAAVDARFAAVNPSGAAAAAAIMTGEPSAAKIASRQRETINRLAVRFAAAGDDADTAADKALKTLHGENQAILDEDLGAVTVQPGSDIDAVTTGLERLRAGVALDEFAPKRQAFPAGGDGEGAFNLALQDFQARVADIRENGRWVNGPGGYMLLNRQGRPVPGPDGQPRIWRDDEVLQVGGAAGAALPPRFDIPWGGT